MGKLILLFALVLLASAGDPKKGIGCADGCNENTLRNLGVNWYYNWGVQPNAGTSVEFVPMCYSLNTISQLPGYSNHLLGFNEPDNEKQGATSPRDAASAWPELVKRSYTTASPAMASNVVNATSWLRQFWKAINGARVDYIAVHHYGKNVSRLQEYLTQIHNDTTFSSRPIWLTEFAAQTN